MAPEEKKQVEKQELTAEVKSSYLDYAMSVIVGRALPDVRDGLKPVHRRILWSMWDSGQTAQAKLKKSANIVGEVLGKYHPHGDLSVYDALVRMAQDFSLRYPLIQGQGNFGCFTKDTKVKLTDGRNLSFEDLVKEYEAGKKNYTYTVNSAGLISIAEIKKPRLTIKNAELVRVVLDNGEEVRCTPNHRFMLKGGIYKEARDLKEGESLKPIYQKLSTAEDRLKREGYVLIHQNKTGEWVPAHHLADNYNLSNHKYAKSAGRVRHHVDFNKLNNSPDNIMRLHWGEHWKIHYEQASRQHQNPDYREKIAAGRKAFWADPRNRIASGERLKERNLTNWKNPEYREKMRKFLSDVNKEYIALHPEIRKIHSERATATLKRLWREPVYRQLFHEKIVSTNKKRVTNNTGKVKFLKICRAILDGHQTLNGELYEGKRGEMYQYGAATTWETGLQKYFNNDRNLVLFELNKNHKVVRVQKLDEREDVYDLTIDHTHNFALAAGVFVHNSVDGDGAAAYRYTEARLSKIAEELLVDIEKETVDWQPNYDGSREEPRVLPAKLPNLLINGSVGIAVGMATNIPPHNLTEVIDATMHLIEHPDAAAEDLTKFIQGPDFPTGGIMYDRKAINQAYAVGRGAITVRAKTEIAERKNDQFDIVVTEIPYQVNKSELIVKIAELVTEKKIEGIKDVRDESGREGMRIVIEVKNNVPPQKILNQLFKFTDLQKDFHLNMLALADGIQPQVLSLKDILEGYLGHRKTVIRRRTEFDLKKAKERAHILEGLALALGVIDKIIATIKKSANREEAHKNLMKQFKLTEIQSNAILDMRLSALAALERQKIEEELAEKKKLIKELELILKSAARVLKLITEELADLKAKYGDERRTKLVVHGLTEFKEEDLVPQEEAMIALSHSGYIKRMPPGTFKVQHRGGKGLIGGEVADEDFITHFKNARTHDNVLFFTDKGRVFQTKAYEIPVGSRTSKGKLVHSFLEIPPTEKISALISYPENAEVKKQSLVMATRDGVIKKTPLADFGNVRRTGIIAIKLSPGDLLNWVNLATGADEIMLTTAQGQAIRFKENQVRPMGRTAAGVTAIRLKKNDRVSSMNVIKTATAKTAKLLVVTQHGLGKQTPLGEYKIQRRGGSGIKTVNITAKTGPLIGAHVITEEKELFALSAKGQIIRTEISTVRVAGRVTQGVRIMNLDPGDRLAGVICL